MRKHSLIIAGRHDTSVTLEDEFWEEFKAAAAAEGLSANALASRIDASRPGGNLSSAIRVYLLERLKNKA